MKIGLMTVAYRERRFIEPHIKHHKDMVDEYLLLASTKPWQGDDEPDDGTAEIALDLGVSVIEYAWPTEEAQRSAGLDYFADMDWVLVIDPDEFLDNENADKLLAFLETAEGDAYVVDHQLTYWRDGYVADPPRDYQQLIAVRPTKVRFVDKRVINSGFGVAPVFLRHFSWSRTNEEIWSKISHYAHAIDFNIHKWYDEVWLKWRPGMRDVHPTTPETLHELIPAKLPPEIEELELWPKY